VSTTGDRTLEADSAFHLTVADHPDLGVSTVRIRDAFLNYAHADEVKANLREVCRTRIDAGVRAFVIDLAAVTVMDSCGLSILISVKKSIESEGAKIGLASLSPMIRRLFAITKLERVFDIHADESAALTALGAA
jgi:anti-sigma B factor antagonist